MSIVNTTECIICYNEFDTETRKPYIGTCGHMICESCKHQMVSSKCPQCNREDAFAITTINYQVLELIKHFKSMQAGTAQNPPQKLFNEETKGLDEGICSECSLRSRKLRICVTCALEQKVLKKDRGDIVLNVIDDKIEKAIQKAKGIAICEDCALDGERHEGHKTNLLALETSSDKINLTITKRRLEAMSDAGVESCKVIESRFGDALTLLRVCFRRYSSLSDSGKQSLLTMMVHNMDRIDNEMHSGKETWKDFEMITEVLNEDKKRILEGGKVIPISFPFLENSQPILVADRKQNDKKLLLIGLFNPKTAMWQPVGRLPNPKSNYAVASNKSQIYIVGGMNNGSWLNTLEVYDKDKKKRRDLASMKKRRTRPSAGFHNSKLFVAGGYDGGYMDSVEYYDPENGDWKESAKLERARADAAVVSCNGDLYVLGGFNGKDYEEKVEKLNESSQKFEVIGDMQGSRAGFGACAFRGRIYVAGGWNNANNTLKSVRSFDPLTKTWSDEPSLIKDRKYFTLHATNEAIYAVRGCADSWERIEEVERFVPKSMEWIRIPCAPYNLL